MVREVKPPLSPAQVVAEFAETLKAYGARKVTADAYSGGILAEMWGKHGIGCEVSSMSRSDLYLRLLPRVNSGQVRLLDLPKLKAQLVGLERRVTRQGRELVDHGRNAHDDVANAAAGALCLAGKPRDLGITIGESLEERALPWNETEADRDARAFAHQNTARADHLLGCMGECCLPEHWRGNPEAWS
jgi:hypothetical protein